MPTSWRSTPPSATATTRPSSPRSRSSPAEGKKTAVVSTINGDSNVPFYKELGNQGLKATDVPVVAFSVGEEELRGVDTKPLVGHLAAWNYFMSIKNPANDRVHQEVERLRQGQEHPGHKDKPLTNDPMEATYIGITCGRRRSRRPRAPTPTRSSPRWPARPSRRRAASPRRWTRRTTTCTSRVHRRDQGRRPVQRGVEDQGPGGGRPLERLHPREQGQEERARDGEEVTAGSPASGR
jgi:urea transport system substrate-binding protein